MSKQIQEQLSEGKARIVSAPAAGQHAPRHQVEVDRNFELPTALFAATVGLYLTFFAVMFLGLSTPGLVIPMAIFTVITLALFGVPAIWTRLKSAELKANDSKPMTIGSFAQSGIMTHTGPLSARDASVQVLILPVLVAIWGLIAVVIAALV